MNTRCGFVAIVGRPNVGKSTLMNRILGKKVSITSRKPQTTRHRIVGIHTIDETQIVFIDTPGLHTQAKSALNKQLNRTASLVMSDVELIVFMTDAGKWGRDDELVLSKLKNCKVPVILAVNKTDKTPSEVVMRSLQSYFDKFEFTETIPVSAKTGKNVDKLIAEISKRLPESPFFYDPETVTDQSDHQWAAEIIREKLMRHLGQEIPYAIAVEVEQFKREEKLLRVSAVIWVERQGQKQIVIGKKGEGLKRIGQQAREEMEAYFSEKVFLQLWVKIKKDWSEDERALKRMGYILIQ